VSTHIVLRHDASAALFSQSSTVVLRSLDCWPPTGQRSFWRIRRRRDQAPVAFLRKSGARWLRGAGKRRTSVMTRTSRFLECQVDLGGAPAGRRRPGGRWVSRGGRRWMRRHPAQIRRNHPPAIVRQSHSADAGSQRPRRRILEGQGRNTVGTLSPSRNERAGKSRKCGTVVFLSLLAFTTLSSGCVTSVPLPGAGDGTANVFVHPITGEVKHCDTVGRPASFRGGVLWRRMLTPDCTRAAENQGFIQKCN